MGDKWQRSLSAASPLPSERGSQVFDLPQGSGPAETCATPYVPEIRPAPPQAGHFPVPPSCGTSARLSSFHVHARSKAVGTPAEFCEPPGPITIGADTRFPSLAHWFGVTRMGKIAGVTSTSRAGRTRVCCPRTCWAWRPSAVRGCRRWRCRSGRTTACPMACRSGLPTGCTCSARTRCGR